MSAPMMLRFVLSAPSVDALPPTPAEVAVVGRSNVGKSSLINALGHRRDLARVSKTPGCTQLLNLFEVGAGGSLVDLPGYGYAAVSKGTRRTWPKMIATYLTERAELRTVMVLVDGEIGPTKLDLQMIDWLGAHSLPVAVIATKHDKVKSQHRLRRRAEVAQACGLDPAEVVWVSAAKGTGIENLRTQVGCWLEAALGEARRTDRGPVRANKLSAPAAPVRRDHGTSDDGGAR